MAYDRPDTLRFGNFLTIAEQIQALSIARKTGEIRILNLAPPAFIGLDEGEVVHAALGETEGLDAAIALINLNGLQTEFVTGPKPEKRSIEIPSFHILITAAVQKDEHTAPSQPTLQIITMSDKPQDYMLSPGLKRIGRDDSNDIVIKHQTVSKRHATIEVTTDRVLLRDLGSTNGTYTDGERIYETALIGRVNLQFGLVPAVFVAPV